MTYRDNPEIAKKYKSKRWQSLRKQKLLLNPLKLGDIMLVNSKKMLKEAEYIKQQE